MKTVCLNMIVKNESAVIQRCLESVKRSIDYWVIVDTGSTDGTQKLIGECLKDIPGELFERPWVDFGHNRNEALELAKGKSDYILLIDADEELVWNEEWPSLEKDGYLSAYHHGNSISDRILLVSQKFDWRWTGSIHEVIECPAADQLGFLSNVFNRASKEGNRSKDYVGKLLNDAKILEDALRKDPNNSRYVFHLANSYEAAGQDQLALRYYGQRTQMPGSEREIFYSLYRIGVLEQKLSFPSDQYIRSFLKAFHFMPSRAEPLFCLAEHYINVRCYLLGYLLTQYALSLPLTDYYFTAIKIYEYGLLYQFAECSFRIGRYQESFHALKQLLIVPDLPEDIRYSSEKNLRSCLKIK